MANISKNHKLYYRAKDGSLRRLDRKSKSLYNFALLSYFTGNAGKEFNKINKDVKHYKDLKSVEVKVIPNLEVELLKIAPKGKLELSYQSSWRPFICLVK